MPSGCSSCGERRAWWATVEASGKRMLVDPDPTDAGIVVKLDRHPGLGPVVRVLTRAEATDGAFVDLHTGEVVELADRPRYVSHFATCPQAARHRRAKPKPLPDNVVRLDDRRRS